MNKNPKICVVVPVFNRINLTTRFIDSFQKSSYKNYEIVIVDDGSTDDTPRVLAKQYPAVKVLTGSGDLWWSGSTNLGVKYALENNFDYVLTINNDAVVDTEYLSNLLSCSQKNPDSLIGSAILFLNTRDVWSIGGHMVWYAENIFNLYFSYRNFDKLKKEIPNPFPVEILNGDGTLIPIGVFKKAGLYDQEWCPQYHGDSEFTLRAAKYGFKSFVCLDAVLENDLSDKAPLPNRKYLVFNKKSDFYWKPILKFFVVYAPLKNKLYFFKQYYRFFSDKLIFRLLHKVWTLMKIIKRFIQKWIKI